jgi:DNA-binding HxlR family transcriptional regulator
MSPEDVCPVAATARILGMRWTLQILHNLRQRRRFCELQKRVRNVNPTTLSQRLKFLESQGVLRRILISDMPPHVEYELTEKGRDLLPILDSMARWANRWMGRVDGDNADAVTASSRGGQNADDHVLS